MPKITPFLWFEDNAEEAAKYYTSIFRNPGMKRIDMGALRQAAGGKRAA